MSSYNLEYENYYKSFNGGSKSTSRLPHGNPNNISKKIIQDLIGTLILFVFTFGCKTINLPSAQYLFQYSKKVVNENYDYKKIITYISTFDYKDIDLKSIEKSATGFMEKIQSKVTGKETTAQWIKRMFIKPVSGKITSGYGYRKDPVTGDKEFHSGVDIDAKENTDVAAAYNGVVQETGNDPELGNYILLNNGRDVETKYAHLNKALVKKGDNVVKGKIIGESGNTGKSTGPHVHFEILIMGENADPTKYINFSTN